MTVWSVPVSVTPSAHASALAEEKLLPETDTTPGEVTLSGPEKEHASIDRSPAETKPTGPAKVTPRTTREALVALSVAGASPSTVLTTLDAASPTRPTAEIPSATTRSTGSTWVTSPWTVSVTDVPPSTGAAWEIAAAASAMLANCVASSTPWTPLTLTKPA